MTDERVNVSVNKETYEDYIICLKLNKQYDEEKVNEHHDAVFNFWLKKNEHAHTQYDSRGFKTIEKILEQVTVFGNMMKQDFSTIVPRGVLEHAIIMVAGADDRTIRKYIKLAIKIRKIKQVDAMTFKRLYLY